MKKLKQTAMAVAFNAAAIMLPHTSYAQQIQTDFVYASNGFMSLTSTPTNFNSTLGPWVAWQDKQIGCDIITCAPSFAKVSTSTNGLFKSLSDGILIYGFLLKATLRMPALTPEKQQEVWYPYLYTGTQNISNEMRFQSLASLNGTVGPFDWGAGVKIAYLRPEGIGFATEQALSVFTSFGIKLDGTKISLNLERTTTTDAGGFKGINFDVSTLNLKTATPIDGFKGLTFDTSMTAATDNTRRIEFGPTLQKGDTKLFLKGAVDWDPLGQEVRSVRAGLTYKF